jgi:lysophospholipase L1-like esterase
MSILLGTIIWLPGCFARVWLARLIRLSPLLLSAPLLFPQYSYACPRIGGLVDFNCDEKHHIVGLGDSFVVGRGDLERPSNPGYISRLQLAFPESKTVKIGIGGISTQRLLAFVKESFEKTPKGQVVKALGSADILIIDAGRNDFFEEVEPSFTVTTLKRIGLYIQRKTKEKFKSSPLIVFAFLAPTTRRFQAPFVHNLNAILLKTRSPTFPVYLRFDLLDESTISVDGVHPIAEGHQLLADLATEYIGDEAQMRSKAQRSDRDKDGIYDQFERRRFRTSQVLADTDGDGLNDGTEVFVLRSNPINADTDGDTVSDGQEVLDGTDPLTVPGQPTTTPTPTPTERPSKTPTVGPTPTVTATPVVIKTPTLTPTATATATGTATPLP